MPAERRAACSVLRTASASAPPWRWASRWRTAVHLQAGESAHGKGDVRMPACWCGLKGRQSSYLYVTDVGCMHAVRLEGRGWPPPSRPPLLLPPDLQPSSIASSLSTASALAGPAPPATATAWRSAVVFSTSSTKAWEEEGAWGRGARMRAQQWRLSDDARQKGGGPTASQRRACSRAWSCATDRTQQHTSNGSTPAHLCHSRPSAEGQAGGSGGGTCVSVTTRQRRGRQLRRQQQRQRSRQRKRTVVRKPHAWRSATQAVHRQRLALSRAMSCNRFSMAGPAAGSICACCSACCSAAGPAPASAVLAGSSGGGAGGAGANAGGGSRDSSTGGCAGTASADAGSGSGSGTRVEGGCIEGRAGADATGSSGGGRGGSGAPAARPCISGCTATCHHLSGPSCVATFAGAAARSATPRAPPTLPLLSGERRW